MGNATRAIGLLALSCLCFQAHPVAASAAASGNGDCDLELIDGFGYRWSLNITLENSAGTYYAGEVVTTTDTRGAFAMFNPINKNLSVDGDAGTGVPFSYNVPWNGITGTGVWANEGTSSGNGVVVIDNQLSSLNGPSTDAQDSLQRPGWPSEVDDSNSQGSLGAEAGFDFQFIDNFNYTWNLNVIANHREGVVLTGQMQTGAQTFNARGLYSPFNRGLSLDSDGIEGQTVPFSYNIAWGADGGVGIWQNEDEFATEGTVMIGFASPAAIAEANGSSDIALELSPGYLAPKDDTQE